MTQMTDIRARFEALIAELKANPEIEVVEADLFGPARPDELARATKKAPGGKLDPFWSAVCAEMNGCRIAWNYKGTKVAPGERPRNPDQPALGGCIRLNGIEFYGTGNQAEPAKYPIHTRVRHLAIDDRNYASLYFDKDDSFRVCLVEMQANDPLDAITPTGLTLERFLELTIKTRGVHDWLRLFASGMERDARAAKAKELIATLFPDVNLDELGPRCAEPRIYPPLAHLSSNEWFGLMREAFGAGDKTRCIEICDGGLSQHPDETAFPHARGLIQKELGLLAEAEASFRQALAIDPSYAQSQQALSNLMLQQGRNDEAEALMIGWVYQSPEVATLHYDIGVAASRRGSKRQALEALTEGLRLDPKLAADAPKEYVSLRDDPDFQALIVAAAWPSNPALWYLPTHFTSRPAPVDLAKTFPELTPKPGIRLHPRARGPLPADASKMGGVFLANDAKGWPTCEEHSGAPYTAVMQLRAADVPQAPFPKGRDVFQLLWCAHDHESNQYAPRIAVRWLQSRELAAPDGANPVDEQAAEEGTYVPRECALFPEVIADYPNRWELRDIEERLMADPELSALGAKIFPEENVRDGAAAYQVTLGSADGTKLLGYPHWVQDPEYPACPECRQPMEHYVTVASTEWDGATFHRWKPIEEGSPETASGAHREDAGLMIGDAGCLYVFVCRNHPVWPTGQVMQCS